MKGRKAPSAAAVATTASSSCSAAARVPAFRLASELRRAGISAISAAGERSLKAQMGHADAIGATYVAILGERELAEKTVTLRQLAGGAQETVPLTDVVSRIRPSR